MDQTSSNAQSICSTTTFEVQDDANSYIMESNAAGVNGSDGYKTPEITLSLPFCGSVYEPDCDDASEPSIGMIFDSWEKGKEFYKAYAHHVGLSIRIGSHKLVKGVVLWKRFVCSREGWRKENNNLSGESVKSTRNIKLTRCGCQAIIGFKRNDDGAYEVA